jgi:hypothetical protein
MKDPLVPIASAALTYRYPDVHARFVQDLSQMTGDAVIVSVDTFVGRYGELADAPETEAARALLATRGIDESVIAQVLERLATLRGDATPDDEKIRAERRDAEEAFWMWYVESSAIARTVITSYAKLRAWASASRSALEAASSRGMTGSMMSTARTWMRMRMRMRTATWTRMRALTMARPGPGRQCVLRPRRCPALWSIVVARSPTAPIPLGTPPRGRAHFTQRSVGQDTDRPPIPTEGHSHSSHASVARSPTAPMPLGTLPRGRARFTQRMVIAGAGRADPEGWSLNVPVSPPFPSPTSFASRDWASTMM